MIPEIERLVRPAILNLQAYKSARSLTTAGRVFLDANESPWPGERGAALIHRYPEPQPPRLLSRLAELYDVTADCVLAGRGSDDAIDTLVRSFCEAGADGILIFPPTYGVYEVAAKIQGAHVHKTVVNEREDFAIDAQKVLETIPGDVKLVFLCSPNNPTGTLIPETTVLTLARGLLGKAMVILDEAYVEFSEGGSLADRVLDFPNLVVLRTLSKAWGMAGARCGVAIAHPDIIALLQKVRAPYPLSSPATELILRGLGEAKECQKRVEALITERKRLETALAEIPAVVRIVPSRANFLLVRVKRIDALLEACRSAGVVIRDRSHEPGLADCVRITVGATTENDLLLEILRGMEQP